MSTWYDEKKGRYCSSIPWKFFYVWTWPLSRWVMFRCMSSEQAHWVGIHLAIPLVYRVEQVWSVLVFPLRLRLRRK